MLVRDAVFRNDPVHLEVHNGSILPSGYVYVCIDCALFLDALTISLTRCYAEKPEEAKD